VKTGHSTRPFVESAAKKYNAMLFNVSVARHLIIANAGSILGPVQSTPVEKSST
jgi:hypothetical protein